MAEMINSRDSKQEVRKAFRMYDEEDHGYIDMEKLKKVRHELGYDSVVTDMECLSMIQVAQPGKDKKSNEVYEDDFMNVMKAAGLFTDTCDETKE